VVDAIADVGVVGGPKGHAFKREDLTGEDAEGQAWKRIDLEVDDTQVNLLRAATDRGEPIYVLFPDGAEVQGHAYKRSGSHTHRGVRAGSAGTSYIWAGLWSPAWSLSPFPWVGDMTADEDDEVREEWGRRNHLK
jgi:hypothetical protein